MLTGQESQAYAGGQGGDEKDAEEVSIVECFVQVSHSRLKFTQGGKIE